MKLKEQIHRSIDALDNHSLVLIYEHVQSLLPAKPDKNDPEATASLEEVLHLTRSAHGEWSDDVAAHREDRL